MTQVRTLVTHEMRMARALESVRTAANTRWDPSREELLEMRHLSRTNATNEQAYEAIKPTCTYATFLRHAKQHGIYFEAGNRTRWGAQWRGK